jgi:hypothetical protein
MAENKTQREIIIEFEQIRTIQKKAKLRVSFCRDCGQDADFVTLPSAAYLFDVTIQKFDEFILNNNCHNEKRTDGCIYICLNSLLSFMREAMANTKISIGD